ncbi:MAG: TetR/AcrR family transcriptional regulator [Gammaproteobacteria bacterium]|jgi:AcrR family transcriptional regulator|nr:TetR/AcrR family transcriptional regulator [Gammaproteobacteria bacterium]
MKRVKNSKSQKAEKREAVFGVAADVFAQYGVRRTAMNDIAQAAGISRPALYLMVENKEDLFSGVVSFRMNQGIDKAISTLSGSGSIAERITAAILAFEKIFYEPVAESPHGAELMDMSISIAADLMKKGQSRLEKVLSQALEEAISNGEVDFSDLPMKPLAFVGLLMSSIGGLKKHATSMTALRRQISEVVGIFFKSIGGASKK